MADVDPAERLVSERDGPQDPVALGATGSCLFVPGRIPGPPIPPNGGSMRPRFVLPMLIGLLTVVLASCATSEVRPSPGATTSPQPTATASPTPSAAATGSPSPLPSATPAVGQTDTDFGRIWDALPPGFPAYPGSTPTETGEGPVSGQFSVPADVATVSTFLQAALEGAGYSTEAMSGPFEDGSVTIDSTNPDFGDCRVRTSIAPAGGTTIVSVWYGADCPFG
jgi:hypothetical protein